jgi:hypothetical protein
MGVTLYRFFCPACGHGSTRDDELSVEDRLSFVTVLECSRRCVVASTTVSGEIESKSNLTLKCPQDVEAPSIAKIRSHTAITRGSSPALLSSTRHKVKTKSRVCYSRIHRQPGKMERPPSRGRGFINRPRALSEASASHTEALSHGDRHGLGQAFLSRLLYLCPDGRRIVTETA